MSKEDKCKMCGQCCHFEQDGKIVACKYLVKVRENKTFCRIYHIRVGTIIGKNEKGRVICDRRENIKKQFEGCPYN